MYSKFENLEEEKRERILKAAMKEFAQKGYDKASTNEIVKEAEIAKGLLFHYFKSKKQLFLYLYNYSIDLVMQDYLTMGCLTDRDLFVRMRQSQQAKLTLLGKYPDIMEFITVAYGDESVEVRAEIVSRNEKLMSMGTGMLFDNVDFSLFKDGLDVPKTLAIIQWTFEGFVNIVVSGMKTAGNKLDFDSAFQEVDQYIDILKLGFYK